MEEENYYEGEELINQQRVEAEENNSEQEKQGARLSLSQLSTIIHSQENGTKIEIDESKEHIKQELTQQIFDVQTRNLVNFSQLYKRANQLDRLPTYNDFAATYPSKNPIKLHNLYLLSQNETIKKEPTLDGKIEQFWKLWKDNHAVYPQKEKTNFQKPSKPSKKIKTTIIPPTEIQQIWDNNPMIEKHHDDIMKNINKKEPLINADVDKYILINDIQTTLNIDLGKNRLQTSPLIHSLRIPQKYPSEPMNLIIYRTQRLPDTPQQMPESQKFQLFLETIAVKMTIDQIISQYGITSISQWSSIHKKEHIPFPRLAKENIAFTNQFVKKINIQDVQNQSLEHKTNAYNIQQSIILTLYNPITGQKLSLLPSDIYLSDQWEIQEAFNKISNITEHYISNKNEFSKIFRPKPTHYKLPEFSTNKNQKTEPTQIAFDIFGPSTK